MMYIVYEYGYFEIEYDANKYREVRHIVSEYSLALELAQEFEYNEIDEVEVDMETGSFTVLVTYDYSGRIVESHDEYCA